MSEKRDRFVRLAENRVNKALKELSLIGNLSNKAAYDFTDEDVRKIFRTLQEGIEKSKQRFADATTQSRGSFRL